MSGLVLRVSLDNEAYCEGCPSLRSTGFCRELKRNMWQETTDPSPYPRPDDCPLESIECLHIG
jgi:hypothetical protein